MVALQVLGRTSIAKRVFLAGGHSLDELHNILTHQLKEYTSVGVKSVLSSTCCIPVSVAWL